MERKYNEKIHRILVLLIACVLSAIIGFGIAVGQIVTSNAMTKIEKRHLKTIVKTAEKYYPKYHILPSVAAGQAKQESGWGTANKHNWYGIKGYSSHGGAQNTLKYMRLIRHSGYYGSAWKKKTAYSQLHEIQRHGYCDPSDDPNYESQVKQIIRRYNLTKYDKRMFKKIKKKKLKRWIKKQRKKKFKFMYDKKVKSYQLQIDKRLVKKGTVLVGYTFYDVKPTKKHLKATIKTGNKKLVGKKIKLSAIWENAKG